MTKRSSNHNLDTPTDGDFASYIERLNTPKATEDPSFNAPDTGMPSVQDANIPPSLPPDLSEILNNLLPFQGFLRPARQVLLLLMALQAVALVFFSGGSFFGILMLFFLWWALGQLAEKLSRLSPMGDAAPVDPQAIKQGVQRLLTQLRSLQNK